MEPLSLQWPWPWLDLCEEGSDWIIDDILYIISFHYQSEQAAVDSLLDRLKKLKDDAEEYSEEEGKRRFETIESQTADCK